MALVAGQVQLPQDLGSIFSGIGTNAYNNINNNYNQARQQSASDASALGRSAPGSYNTQRLGTTQGLDIGNLESGMGSALGNAGYQNQIAQRNYGQQRQLADIIGAASAPSTLQEIFQGIGGGAKAITPWLGMMGGPSSSVPGSQYANTPNSLSLMPTDYSGFENYGFPGYGGGF